jgi:carboxypeptidase Q
MKKQWLALAVVIALLSVSVLAQNSSTQNAPDHDGTKPALARIAGQGLVDSRTFQYLTELSDDVGGRVTGSVASQKAIEWGVAKMKAIGLANVHTEPVSVWKGWIRGSAEAEMLIPAKRKLYISAMGWTGSTPGSGVDADLVVVNFFDLDKEMKNTTKYRGKIVYVIAQEESTQNFWTLFGEYPEFLRRLHEAGALAVIGGNFGFKSEGLHLTHTGILGFGADVEIPVLSTTREDAGQIERFLAAGKLVRLHINVQNTFTSGPIQSANVVGEIPGREHPEQIVVAGAHLDSWDLSEGTTDNGTGVCTVLGAADAIMKSDIHPRRTIRFVLFTGEEQGELGSLAYIQQHSGEMKDHIAGIVLDSGQGPVREAHLGRTDVVESFTPFARSLANIAAIKVVAKAEPGTDSGPFILAGLPGINLEQDSPEYKYTEHSAADALEAAKPDSLAQNATIMAMTAYWLADRPERFASPWAPERTAKMLREQGDSDKWKAFGLWPFPKVGN